MRSERTRDDLPLLGEPFAIELANTWYVVGGGASSDRDFLSDEWAPTWWQHGRPPLSPEDLDVTSVAGSLRDLRDALRQVLLRTIDGGDGDGRDVAGALRTIQSAAERAPGFVELREGVDGLEWQVRHDGVAGDVSVALAADQCMFFLAGEDVRRVRRCARPGCPMMFVQHHRRRTFCHRTCAQRVRQARYEQAASRRASLR